MTTLTPDTSIQEKRKTSAAPDAPAEESFRDHIPTVDSKGKRVWIYPRKPKGNLYRYRTYLSWILLLILFTGPFIRIRGNPLLMMNIPERTFSLFGFLFGPQDLHLFAIAMVTMIIMIVLFTTVFGRVWCGWLCPQTVLMEMVFRKIEYFIEGDAMKQRALNKAPWTAPKLFKKTTKHLVFFALSFVIGNLLLAYIIGSDRLIEIITDNPVNHVKGLTTMIAFSLVFYGIFARFREQACTFICPYGRLQSVLLDENSIVVAFDDKRGLPHAKFNRNLPHEARRKSGTGDCINCGLCVAVCPTGIDIRNGTQLECVNCTACIDACNGVMDKLKFPRGLIRYASLNGIDKGQKLSVTPRIIGYALVIAILASVLVVLLAGRKDISASMLRTPGTLYQELPGDRIGNLYQVTFRNKAREPRSIRLKLERPEGTVTVAGGDLTLGPVSTTRRPVIVSIHRDNINTPTREAVVGVYVDGNQLQELKSTFIGPDPGQDATKDL